eukprot:SAG11_NODE_106_length_16423_cov_51.220840_9_plen_122_part_00
MMLTLMVFQSQATFTAPPLVQRETGTKPGLFSPLLYAKITPWNEMIPGSPLSLTCCTVDFNGTPPLPPPPVLKAATNFAIRRSVSGYCPPPSVIDRGAKFGGTQPVPRHEPGNATIRLSPR